MSYREFLPHPGLRPYVDRYWIRAPAAEPVGATLHVLPDGCMDLIISADPSWGTVVVGTMRSARLVHPRELAAPMTGVRFRPGAALPLLGLGPIAHELIDRVADLRTLVRRPVVLPSELAEANAAPAEIVSALDATLLRRASGAERPDRRLGHAVAALSSPAPPTISVLARELGLSRQQLGRIFRRQVGIGPKRFARVARMQRTVSLLQRRSFSSLGAAALVLGYFDQAHMTAELRDLARATPGEVSRAAGSIPPIRSLFPCA